MSKILQKVLRYSYCRKSQEDDSRQVLSLPAQNQAVRDIWVRQNATCDEIFEEAKSAKVPGRKLLNKMLDSIEECGAGEIACWKLDRLARNFIDGGRIIDMIQRGVIRAIHTYEKTYLPTDNVLMMAVEFGMANQFIRDLSTNTKRGLRAKIAAGQPPRAAVVGYKNNLSTHNWEIDPYYAPIVCQIFEWYDTGLYSELDIVEKLKEAGILTKKGKQFHKSTIGRMLRDPAYYGYFYANGELYRGTYEPIINKELWDRVQDRINGRVTYNHKKGKLVFNYKGIMHCFECGCEVTAEYQHQCICTNCKKKFSIKNTDRCPQCKTQITDMDNPTIFKKIYNRCTKSKGKKSCSQPYILEEELEPQLLNILDGIKLDQEDIDEVHSELIGLYEKDQELQKVTLKNLKTELIKLEDEKQRIFKRLLLGDIDPDDREMALELKQSIAERIKAITAQIDKLGHDSYNWLEQSSNVLKLANRATELFLAAKPAQKAQLLNFVASNLVLKNKKVLFEYNKPFVLAAKIKAHKAERPDKVSGRPIWLRRQGSNLRPIA